ncbi:YfcC family protein [Algoriphagus lacus]|uniref:YfcC family protein n=1 Tax=Algoriphagus lacus TaxID=2056311 RepID=A0A418PQ71_9BACT|nr:YfcC family protein [Algoriphagus lacus]RIW14385.1 YfcC family protein [Algoriphagus lacus]
MKLSFPHPLIILLVFIILAALATLIVPSGSYDRVLDEETGREIVVPGSYQLTEDKNASIFDTGLAIPEGIILGADILVLILLIGGAFYVIEKTGALQVGMEALVYRFRNTQYLLLVILSLFFFLGGASFGMQEEIIAMGPILVLLAKKINYDVRATVALSLGSALAGASFSPINPFGSLLAQKIAEVDFAEGLFYRLIFTALVFVIWTGFHVRWGKSKLIQLDKVDFKPAKISGTHAIILTLTLAGMILMPWGIIQQEWGYNEMSALFFVIGLSCGLIGKMGLNGTARAFSQGFSEMIFAGVLVGLARSVYLILEKSQIIDTLIQAMFQPLEALPTTLATIGIFFSQGIIHGVVPSTSGQAVLTIPLASPLVDLMGISRQIAVLTYQYPAGLMDLIIPNNGGMMAVIAAAGIAYNDWIRYIWKSWLLLLGIGLISSILALLWFA